MCQLISGQDIYFVIRNSIFIRRSLPACGGADLCAAGIIQLPGNKRPATNGHPSCANLIPAPAKIRLFLRTFFLSVKCHQNAYKIHQNDTIFRNFAYIFRIFSKFFAFFHNFSHFFQPLQSLNLAHLAGKSSSANPRSCRHIFINKNLSFAYNPPKSFVF